MGDYFREYNFEKDNIYQVGKSSMRGRMEMMNICDAFSIYILLLVFRK